MIDERIVGNVVERILHGVGNRLFHGRNVVMTPEEIEELRALVGRLGANAYDKNLAVVLGAALEHIDQQAKQIAALREIAIEERIPWLQAREYEPPVTLTWIEQEARRQLAEEYPEAFR